MSKYTTSANQAKSVRCGEPVLEGTGNGSGCNARLFTTVDNRGYQDGGWDWDVNYVKGECRKHEYVQAVAQDTNMHIDGIHCCPATVNHRNCTTEEFYSGNSSSYSSPDWSYSYWKGQCGAGKYVAGVSAVSQSGYGVIGAPHRILCCSP